MDLFPKIFKGNFYFSALTNRCLLAGFWLLITASTAAAIVTVGTKGNEPIVLHAPPERNAMGVLVPNKIIYISALQHIYRSTDDGATWAELTATLLSTTLNVASDSSIAVDPTGRLYFSFDYPYAGSTAVCVSVDHGDTFTCNPAVLPGGTDRMWIVAPADKISYEVTNEGLYETTFGSSTDGGTTYLPSQFGSGLLEPQTGPLFKVPGSSHVLEVTKLNGLLSLYVFSPMTIGTVLSDMHSTALPGPVALPSGSLDTTGGLYVATETANPAGGKQVIVARTADEGLTWTQLPPIPQTLTGTSTFTWVAAGTPNHVGVIYYYTPDNGDPGTFTTAVWSAMYAETYNATAAQPTWKTTTLESGVHTGAICVGADCMGTNRFAGDFISSFIDSAGNSQLTWMRETAGAASIRFQSVNGVAPTAAPIVLAGRVTTAQSRGVNNARLVLTENNEKKHYAATNIFGYFRFSDIPAGKSVVVSISAKNFSFAQSSIVANALEDNNYLNFQAKK